MILADINRAGQSASDSLLISAFSDPNQYIQTQAEIIRSSTMADTVHDHLERNYQELTYARKQGEEAFVPSSIPSAETLLDSVKVTRAQNTSVFYISATSGHPLLSRDIAQAYGEEYILNRQLASIKQISEARKEVWNRIQEVQSQIEDVANRAKQYTKDNMPPDLEAEAAQAVNLWGNLYEKYMSLRISEALEQRGLEIIEPAKAGKKVSPRTARNLILALFLGMIFGLGLVFLVDYLDSSLKTREEFEKNYNAPILGEIARIGGSGESENGVIYFNQQDSIAAEGYRNLRTNVQFLNLECDTKLIMVTSASPKEGKTSVAINLAAALSEMGKRTIVVEADLRRPVLRKFMNYKQPTKGLTEVLMGTATLEEVLLKAANTNLYVLLSGVKPPNPAELVASQAMKNTFQKLRDTYDYVIADAPPVLAVSDAIAMAPMMDGVILVASYGMATREAARHTAELLGKVETRVLGVVINKVEIASRYGYGYGYGYRPYQYYSYVEEEEPKRGWRRFFRK
jgi:capsular exopolysaccharide synthesis family protein